MLSLCSAAALTIGMHIGSYHTADNSKYKNGQTERSPLNNINPGVYVAYDGYTAGTYKNSYNRQTVYAGKAFDITENCRYDVLVGAATGYNIKGSSVVPFVVGSAKFNIQDEAILRVSAIPQVSSEGKLKGAVLHLSLQRNFQGM